MLESYICKMSFINQIANRITNFFYLLIFKGIGHNKFLTSLIKTLKYFFLRWKILWKDSIHNPLFLSEFSKIHVLNYFEYFFIKYELNVCMNEWAPSTLLFRKKKDWLMYYIYWVTLICKINFMILKHSN